MRAICEACQHPQPVDWRPGDLCIQCGAAVRRDVRCFWCAEWTPFAKFCRGCGAEVVEERLFGAARMIKHAGTDRFTVPKMLRELDPEQLDNFSRIYQRHAVVAASHVDDLSFLERFLHRKSFSAALDDELVAQLPWDAPTLQRMSTRGSEADGDPPLTRVNAIAERTPIGRTVTLAGIVRLRLGDRTALTEVRHVLSSGDDEVSDEAALVLVSWRVVTLFGRLAEQRDLIARLRTSPFVEEAAVGLALLGAGDVDSVRSAIGSADPDIAFAAALVCGDADRLQAALSADDIRTIAAGMRLIELGILHPLERPLRDGSVAVQIAMTDALCRRTQGAAELAATLLHLVETTDSDTVRERAARVLCRAMPVEYAIRIARAGGGEQYIAMSLLSEQAALPADVVHQVCTHLVSREQLRASQYGVKEAAERGSIPDGFVPACFSESSDASRVELIRIAETQLAARGDESLHLFVMGVVFGPFPAVIRAAAWWALVRWYHRDDLRSFGPCTLKPEGVQRFFGTPTAPAFRGCWRCSPIAIP
ncbi:MAG: hypothetical protein H0V44_14515 [Planctomycetes bacterium]|nr:hypothetical protein [Planctomycetota bacterium]